MAFERNFIEIKYMQKYHTDMLCIYIDKDNMHFQQIYNDLVKPNRAEPLKHNHIIHLYNARKAYERNYKKHDYFFIIDSIAFDMAKNVTTTTKYDYAFLLVTPINTDFLQLFEKPHYNEDFINFLHILHKDLQSGIVKPLNKSHIDDIKRRVSHGFSIVDEEKQDVDVYDKFNNWLDLLNKTNQVGLAENEYML